MKLLLTILLANFWLFGFGQISLGMSEVYVLNVSVDSISTLRKCPCGFSKKDKCYDYKVQVKDVILRTDTALFKVEGLLKIDRMVGVDSIKLEPNKDYVLTLSNADTKDYLLVYRHLNYKDEKFIYPDRGHMTGLRRCYKLTFWQRLFNRNKYKE
jgi:hypothetical protein